jgi:hypothetical protein
VSWVVWAICGGVRWSEGIDLRDEPACRERESTAWKDIVGQREVQAIGWSEAIDWKSKFGWNEIIDWKLGIGRGGVIDRKLHPLCMVHNTDPIGGLGRTGKFGPGVMVAFSFGPFVAAAENGGSMRVGSKCRVNGLLRRWIQGILGENY